MARTSLILWLSIVTLSAQHTGPGATSTLATSSKEIDGVALRVRSSLEKRNDAATPIVVFESGAGMPLEPTSP